MSRWLSNGRGLWRWGLRVYRGCLSRRGRLAGRCPYRYRPGAFRHCWRRCRRIPGLDAAGRTGRSRFSGQRPGRRKFRKDRNFPFYPYQTSYSPQRTLRTLRILRIKQRQPAFGEVSPASTRLSEAGPSADKSTVYLNLPPKSMPSVILYIRRGGRFRSRIFNHGGTKKNEGF